MLAHYLSSRFTPGFGALKRFVLNRIELPRIAGIYMTKRTKRDLAGKNIVYIGGYGRIGFAVCKMLMCGNVKGLVILDVEENTDERKELEALNPGDICFDYKQMDLTNCRASICESIHEANNTLGNIDILINGSGLIQDRDPQRVVDVCLMGVIFSVLEALPLMSIAEGGVGGLIINISSVLGLEPGHFMAVHSAAKHGIVGFTRCLAHPHYLEHTGVAHVVICPGPTRTGAAFNLKGFNTFDYSKPILNELKNIESQNLIDCASRFLEILEIGENDDCWIIDLGKKERVKYHTYWKYTYKDENK